MTSVRTASRLHFGLLNLEDAAPWPNRDGQPTLPGRSFGGVGLMVREPGVWLRTSDAAEWGAQGPLAGHALTFARHYAAAVGQEFPDLDLPAQQIVVERAAPEHAGLGTGTQLGLATGRALARAWKLDETAAVLARSVGRGLRSALGVHGFEHGGFLVEAGKRAADDLSPLVARAAFPDDWRVVLVLRSGAAGIHGPREREAFSDLAQNRVPRRQTEALCRLALVGLLPALMERDLTAFGEALYDFNARSGELFAPVQGGVYATPEVAAVVAFVRRSGVRGTGQSSWGPAVFAVVEDENRAADLAQQLRGRFGFTAAETLITRSWNRPADVS